MLTTIADLEKEIDEFHKNVTASNKLASLIDSMLGALKEQSFVLSQKADALQQLINALPNDIKSGNESLVKLMLDSFSSEQKKYEQALESAQKNYVEKLAETEKVVISIPKELKKDNESALAGQVELLKKVQDSYTATLKESQAGFVSQSEAFIKVAQELSATLEKKHHAFLEKLESNNMEQIYKYCQDMNKSLTTKLVFLIGGVAVSVTLAIVSFFI